MAQLEAYFDIRDWLDQQDVLDPPAFLSRLQTGYATGPVTYLDAVICNGRLRSHIIHHSHRRDALQIARNLHRKPAVEQILRVYTALEPIQLTGWHGSGRSGHAILGYPLPGLHSCLLVEIGLGREALSAWRRSHDRDLLSLGSLFNARLAASARVTNGPTGGLPLTRRERETLAWIAAGKSYWETAVILGISERTIRHFMANARHKLDVVTNAQAVAEAVWRGLIPRLADTQVP